MSIAHINSLDGGIKPHGTHGDAIMLIVLASLIGSSIYAWWHRRQTPSKEV